MVRDVKEDDSAIALIHASAHYEVKELCQALLNCQKWAVIAPIIKTFKEDPERIRMAVLGYMNTVLLNNGKSNDVAALIIEQFSQTFIYNGKAGLSYAAYTTQKYLNSHGEK
jgi:hypothetical protein